MRGMVNFHIRLVKTKVGTSVYFIRGWNPRQSWGGRSPSVPSQGYHLNDWVFAIWEAGPKRYRSAHSNTSTCTKSPPISSSLNDLRAPMSREMSVPSSVLLMCQWGRFVPTGPTGHKVGSNLTIQKTLLQPALMHLPVCTCASSLIQQQAFPAFHYLTSILEDPSCPSTSRAEIPVCHSVSSCISVSKPVTRYPQCSVTSHWQITEAVLCDLCVGWPQVSKVKTQC